MSGNLFYADPSPPVFREKMKEISLWGKIVGAIKRLFGFETLAPEVSNALAEAERVLVKMLDNYDMSTYDAIRDKLQRTVRGRRNAVLGERLEVEAPQLNKYRVEKIFGGIWIGDKKEFAKFVTAVDNYAFEEDGEGKAYIDNFFYAYYLNIDGRVIPYASVYLNRYESQDVVNLVNKEIGNVRQGERVKFYFDTAIARARAAKSKNNAYNGGNSSVPATTNNGRLGSGLLRRGGYYDHPDLYVKTQRADRFGPLDEEEEFFYCIEEKVISPDSQQIFDTARERFGTTLDMLHTIGFDYKGGTISDSELRYILWRSHKNLKDGRYADVFSQAKYLHINAVVLGVSIHAPTRGATQVFDNKV